MSVDRELPPPKRKSEIPPDQVDSKLLFKVLSSVRRGDFGARMPGDHTGMAGKIYDVLNEIIELNERTVKELMRVSNVVGKEGRLNQRASVTGAVGDWSVYTDAVNSLVTDLV